VLRAYQQKNYREPEQGKRNPLEQKRGPHSGSAKICGVQGTQRKRRGKEKSVPLESAGGKQSSSKNSEEELSPQSAPKTRKEKKPKVGEDDKIGGEGLYKDDHLQYIITILESRKKRI